MEFTNSPAMFIVSPYSEVLAVATFLFGDHRNNVLEMARHLAKDFVQPVIMGLPIRLKQECPTGWLAGYELEICTLDSKFLCIFRAYEPA